MSHFCTPITVREPLSRFPDAYGFLPNGWPYTLRRPVDCPDECGSCQETVIYMVEKDVELVVSRFNLVRDEHPGSEALNALLAFMMNNRFLDEIDEDDDTIAVAWDDRLGRMVRLPFSEAHRVFEAAIMRIDKKQHPERETFMVLDTPAAFQ